MWNLYFLLQLAKDATSHPPVADVATKEGASDSYQKTQSSASPSKIPPSSAAEKEPRYYPAPDVYINTHENPERVRYVVYDDNEVRMSVYSGVVSQTLHWVL